MSFFCLFVALPFDSLLPHPGLLGIIKKPLSKGQKGQSEDEAWADFQSNHSSSNNLRHLEACLLFSLCSPCLLIQ